MSLFEDESKEIHHFPTHPAFLCPVEIRDMEEYGPGHKGVFALENIAYGTKFWVWTHRVVKIHHEELEKYIETNIGNTDENIDAMQLFLRKGFVLPPSKNGTGKKDHYFYSNPYDADDL
ncbi:hypothetical protein HJC23_006103 [Cyclotella cryptica]|uniref:Uncharacterized protein n=1 Tax=Cyclotella cryptica TaxID=29204 RepID=A0ABD3QL63_9STRA|eukprot:CCRYP_004565-RA/>CCRYP_004565-RA protein AED:0.13 eAED:0.13 QI:0/-1/0/1/-1/1/1/0/118